MVMDGGSEGGNKQSVEQASQAAASRMLEECLVRPTGDCSSQISATQDPRLHFSGPPKSHEFDKVWQETLAANPQWNIEDRTKALSSINNTLFIEDQLWTQVAKESGSQLDLDRRDAVDGLSVAAGFALDKSKDEAADQSETTTRRALNRELLRGIGAE